LVWVIIVKWKKIEKPSEVRLKKDKIEDAEKMNLRYGKIHWARKG